MVSTTSKTQSKELLLIEQEISLVKFLSSNTEIERNRALKKIKKWLTYRSNVKVDFTENEFRIMWKGLFYCLWMADKPLYQEEVAENISRLIHCFTKLDDALLFVRAFFSIMSQDWLGIDHLRLDKCLMLVRRVVRQSMEYVKQNHQWSQLAVDALATCYRSILKKSPTGLIMHLCELYLIELAKVSGGSISSHTVLNLVRPFGEHLSTLSEGRQISQVVCPIFLNLIQQTEIGIEHQIKWQAWRDRRFAGGTIDALQKVEDDDEDYDEDEESENEIKDEANDDDDDDDDDDNDDSVKGERPLDPRAGRIDVELPLLEIEPLEFVKMLNELRERKETTMKARKQMMILIKKFSILSEGRYPLGMQKVDIEPKENWKKVIKSTARQLAEDQLEEEVKAMEMLDNQHTESSPLKTSVGSWSVEPINNKLQKRRKKKQKRKMKLDSNWDVSPSYQKKFHKTNGINGEHTNTFVASPTSNKTSENELGTVKRKAVDKHKKQKKRRKTGKTEIDVNCQNGGNTGWEGSIQEGETEIFIPNKKYVKKRMEQGLSVPLPEFIQKSPKTPERNTTLLRKSPYSSNKKVLFVLTRNMAQDEKEYQELLRAHPEVPFNAEKQPEHPIYKDKGVKSPIDPFAKRLGYMKMKGF